MCFPSIFLFFSLLTTLGMSKCDLNVFCKKRKMMKIFIFTFMHEIYVYFYEFEREATCRRHILTFVMDECERKQILYCTFNNNKKKHSDIRQ